MSSIAADETSEITGNLTEKPKNCDAENDEEDELDDEEGEIYEVERILKDKFKRGTRVYLVRWKGYGAEEDSWEPEDNLEGAKDVLNAYLAALEKKKSVRSSTKEASGGKKSSGSKRASSRTTYKEPSDDEEGDDGSKSGENDSEHNFVPKKKSRKSETSVKSKKTNNGTPVGTPSSNVDKQVARRKNLSQNMRWITESSDDSDGAKSDVDGEETEDKKSPGSAIHPDSSTDIGQKLNGTSISTASTNNSLKLKISKDGVVVNGGRDQTPSTPKTKSSTAHASGKTSATAEPEKNAAKEKTSSKKSRRVEKDADDVVPPNANTKSTLTFTGVYRENKGGELRYVAIDDKTKKREIYVLGDAFIADGWSLCRFLSSKVKFAPDGSVMVAGEDGPSGSNGN